MNLRLNIPIRILLSLMLIFLGACSSGESNLLEPLPPQEAGSRLPEGSESHTLLGYFSVAIDLANKTVDVVPLRDVQFHLNVLPFLEPPPLTNLTLGWETLEIDWDKWIVETDVILTHPFYGLNEFMGFDVKGILITDGSLDGFEDDGIVIASPAEPRLANADGFTRWWNPQEFIDQGIFGYKDGLLGVPDSSANYHSTLNGYKYFADDLTANEDVTDLNMGLRGRFSAGASNRRHYVIDFGENTSDFLVFNYAVDANWYPPDKIPPTGLQDFPISANQTEAFAIVVNEELNRLYYNPVNEDSGGKLDLRIDIFDWQCIETIVSVKVEAPNVFEGAVYCTPDPANDPESRQGTYYASIEGSPQAVDQKNNFLISIEDIHGTFEQDGMNSFTGSDDLLTTAYYVHTADISPNSPPVVGPVSGPEIVEAGKPYLYSVSVGDYEDTLADLYFAWEIGDDSPPEYDNEKGYGKDNVLIAFPSNGGFLVDVKVTDTDGGWTTSEQPLLVNSSWPDSPDPVGNIKLEVQRDAFHIIDTLKISWDPVLGGTPPVAQYAVYYTDDPYTPGDFEFEGVSPLFPTEYIIDPLNKNAAYLFTVRTRSMVGKPATESGDSQYAFVEFETAEDADPYPWTVGSRTGGVYTDHFGRATGAGTQAGQKGWRMDIENSIIYNGAWSVIASNPIPVFDSVEEYRIEFLRHHPSAFNYHGLAVGTTDVIYPSSDSTFPSFDVSKVFVEGFNYTDSSNNYGIRDRFVESSTNAAAFNDSAAYFHYSAFQLPRLGVLIGEGKDARAAFGYGGAVIKRTARVELDEIALIVY